MSWERFTVLCLVAISFYLLYRRQLYSIFDNNDAWQWIISLRFNAIENAIYMLWTITVIALYVWKIKIGQKSDRRWLF